MELEGNSNAGTSVAFLEQSRERHGGRLNVIWDNAPAHRGEVLREYLGSPGLNLRLVNLPGYSPDFNADEAIWGWVRESLPSWKRGRPPPICAWDQNRSAGEGQPFLRRSGQPESRSEAALPDGPSIKG